MFQFVIVAIILIIAILYEKYRRPYVCGKKINEYIESLNGKVLDIRRISSREEIYLVDYKLGEQELRKNVKFNLLYKYEWY